LKFLVSTHHPSSINKNGIPVGLRRLHEQKTNFRKTGKFLSKKIFRMKNLFMKTKNVRAKNSRGKIHLLTCLHPLPPPRDEAFSQTKPHTPPQVIGREQPYHHHPGSLNCGHPSPPQFLKEQRLLRLEHDWPHLVGLPVSTHPESRQICDGFGNKIPCPHEAKQRFICSTSSSKFHKRRPVASICLLS
jgi:hypothetical protein